MIFYYFKSFNSIIVNNFDTIVYKEPLFMKFRKSKYPQIILFRYFTNIIQFFVNSNFVWSNC